MIATPLLALLLMQPVSVDQQIRTRYVAWDAAYREMNLDALDRLLDSEFTLVTERGTILSKSSYLARLAKADRPGVYETTVLRVKVTGSRATVHTSEKSGDKGKPPSTHFYIDTWILRDGHWRMLQSRTTGER
ncbi:MAG: nuclear transport factor 2 family protein [Methanoregulaceae archaeon]|nr:nuclear transport factor 2 family protein [Methanoregulaceae archaeon]